MPQVSDKGLFRRKGSPHWWIRYADRNGRIVRTSTNTTNKTLAREVLSKQRTLVAENRHLDVKKIPNITFYELCTQYWEMHGKTLRTKGLLKINKDGSQSGMIEIWKTGLGNVMLSELTQHKIEKFLSERSEEEELSTATYNRHLSMLKSMLNKGREWDWLHENPAASIKKRKEDGGRTRFLSGEEVQILLDGASGQFKSIIITALHTGMRRGELLGLQWKDVDLHNRIIVIQHSKSGRKRMIPLDDTVHETLKKLTSTVCKGSRISFKPKWDGCPDGYEQDVYQAHRQGGVEGSKVSRPQAHLRFPFGNEWCGRCDRSATSRPCPHQHDHAIRPPCA